jgi:hypothetical protein
VGGGINIFLELKNYLSKTQNCEFARDSFAYIGTWNKRQTKKIFSKRPLLICFVHILVF